ncbi:hypothetical protein SGGMMB4_05712 [Sodalis glossinidius str. 'morsitans']|uniref:Uncharacterized protein n=1 Tax=Sodalis glossinidius (strain morsitans) TaxID=343509 RepID=A0A193QNJ8_SODGM|nr:hypothetical protein [Sodalis glossinidius]CRL46799.1 hypothetical protein SGGMMB4_05712 [Sodalis glossinidius str. 'morsitans']
MRINLFMHLAAMIERLMTHDGLNHREDRELPKQQRHFIALTPEASRPLINK